MHKRSKILSLLFTYAFSCFLSTNLLSNPAQIKLAAPVTQTTPPSRLQKLFNPALTLLYIELFYLTAQDSSKQAVKEQLAPDLLCKNFLKEYFSHFIATFFHETGHALVARALTKRQAKIHLGSTNATSKPYITAGNYSLNGLNPSQGFTEYAPVYNNFHDISRQVYELFTHYCETHNIDFDALSQQDIHAILIKIKDTPEFLALENRLEKNKPKEVSILLAGGIAGLTGYFLVKMLGNFLMNCATGQTPTTWDNLKHACSQTFSIDSFLFDSVTIHQLFSMLVPFTTGIGASDGSRLWKTLGVNEETVNTVGMCAPYLEMGVHAALACHNPNATKDAALIDKIFIGLINYQLRHLLALHA